MDLHESSLAPEALVQLQSIRVLLPAYTDLSEPQDRRGNDESIRAYLSRLLGALKAHLISLQMYLHAHNLDALLAQNILVSEMAETFSEKVQNVPYAFSLFFTAPRLSQQQQEKIIDADYHLLNLADKTESILEPTLDGTSDFGGVLSAVQEKLRSLDSCFEERINHILELH
jgi:hypothetical protein